MTATLIDETTILDVIIAHRAQAEVQAWRAMSRYQWAQFGEYATMWARYNHLLPPNLKAASPFRSLVHIAKARTL